MRSGALRQRVQIQSPPTTADGMGGFTGTWTPVATTWAQIDPQSGAERIQGDQVTALMTHTIVIRYRPGIVPKMRLVRLVGGQTFEIHSVDNAEFRNRQLTLQCSEVQSAPA